jgi:ribonuclease P protein component
MPAPGQAAATGPGLVTLARRADFLAASRARRQSRAGLVLQARARPADEAPGAIRVGYTCSRKLGNAVARNRAKRRLRAAARAVLPQRGLPGWDYVLIGRPEATAARPFASLCEDLTSALAAIHDRRAK